MKMGSINLNSKRIKFEFPAKNPCISTKFNLNCLKLPFSPTNGRLHVKTSMKFGSQYGCGLLLNCLMFMTLFSYLSTAALLL